MVKRCLLYVLLTAFISCNQASKQPLPDETDRTETSFLVFEKEIKGEVLGITLDKPFGLAVDFQGNIYLSDAGNDRIIKFDNSLKPIAQFGGFGSQEGMMNFPTYLGFDNGLNLMVSDEKNRRISRFNSQLHYVDQIRFSDDDDPNKFGYPSGIAFTQHGEVWVADRENNQIMVFNNVGNFDHILGDFGYGGGQLASPEKIIRTKSGNFIVCDAGNQRLIVYDEYGTYKSEMESDEFSYPISLAVSKERFFILDSDLGVVFQTNKQMQIESEYGPKIPGDHTSLRSPSDLILLPDNGLLISDSGNNRLLLGRLIFEE